MIFLKRTLFVKMRLYFTLMIFKKSSKIILVFIMNKIKNKNN